MTYYAETAYDSTKNYDLPPIDKKGPGEITTLACGFTHIDHPKEAQCREFLSSADSAYIEEFQDLDNHPEIKNQIETGKIHEEFPFSQAVADPVVTFIWLTNIAGVGALITSLFGIFHFIPRHGIGWLLSVDAVFLTGLPILVYTLGKYLLRNNFIEDKSLVIINRRTGLVTFPKFGKGKHVIPFAEFEPFSSHNGKNFNIVQKYQLWLYHRDGKPYCTNTNGRHRSPILIYRDWEFLQQYMDVSKPLPDLPEFEPYRHKDPTTAKYDKKNKRPQNYWQELDLDKIREMHDASYKALEQFPWGKTRQQALDLGWQPSGFGQGDWLRQ